MKKDHKIFMMALLSLSITLTLISCSSGGGGGSAPGLPLIGAELDSFPTGSAPPGFLPSGFNSLASVYVIDDNSGAAITNAAVTMNGVPLTYNATHQDYEGNLVVDFGGSVDLNVTVGGNVYTASGTQFTSYPVISTPASGATWPTCLSNTVAWSGGTSILSSYYGLGVLDAANPNGPLVWPSGNTIQTVSGAAYYSIPGNSLTAGNRLVILGIASDIVVSNAAPGSTLTVGGFNYVPITIANNGSLGSISVSPTNPTTPKGTTQQFTAVGQYCDGTTQDLTTSATWSSSNTGIATISNAAGSNGKANIITSGTTTISATSSGVEGSTTLTVSNWTQQTSGTSNELYGVAWSGTQYVAVGNGVILTSPDAVTWTSQTLNIPLLFKVRWLGSQFLATGGGAILTSPDGITWTSRLSGIGGNDVAWSGSQYVAVGYGGVILTSPDGIVWTQQNSGASQDLFGITWDGHRFVVVGGYPQMYYGNIILTSPDGVTWTAQTPSISYTLTKVVWSGYQFVAIGSNGYSYQSNFFTSQDAVSWAQYNLPGQMMYDIAWSGTNYVAVGLGGTIYTSPDGNAWTSVLSGTNQGLIGVEASANKYVAVGWWGTILTYP